MDNNRLKEALSQIWALVYLSTSRDLDLNQLDELQEAMGALGEWPENDPFKGRASHICMCVRSTGILSIPSRKPKGTEEILRDCQSLSKYLDSN